MLYTSGQIPWKWSVYADTDIPLNPFKKIGYVKEALLDR